MNRSGVAGYKEGIGYGFAFVLEGIGFLLTGFTLVSTLTGIATILIGLGNAVYNALEQSEVFVSEWWQALSLGVVFFFIAVLADYWVYVGNIQLALT